MKMGRIYINSDEAKITRDGSYTLNLEFFNGKSYEKLEPRCLFPITGPTRYISLINEKNEEIAVIRNLDNLMEESKRAVSEVLKEYYLIPKITGILDRSEKYGILKWRAVTDRGVRDIEISNRQSDIKIIYATRVLIRDSNDNRYEIPDTEALDAKSFRKIAADL